MCLKNILNYFINYFEKTLSPPILFQTSLHILKEIDERCSNDTFPLETVMGYILKCNRALLPHLLANQEAHWKHLTAYASRANVDGWAFFEEMAVVSVHMCLRFIFC